MDLQGYCVVMVHYIYISAQERDDAGIAGALMGGGNSYSSGPFQLLSGGYCDGHIVNNHKEIMIEISKYMDNKVES